MWELGILFKIFEIHFSSSIYIFENERLNYDSFSLIVFQSTLVFQTQLSTIIIIQNLLTKWYKNYGFLGTLETLLLNPARCEIKEGLE